MNDLEQILKVRDNVLENLKNKFPGMAQTCKNNDYLCYFIGTQEDYYPVIDFTRTMPDNMTTYRTMINESATEYANNLKFNYNPNISKAYDGEEE